MQTRTGPRAAPKIAKPEAELTDERSVSVRLPSALDQRVKNAHAEMVRETTQGRSPNASDALREVIEIGLMAFERGMRIRGVRRIDVTKLPKAVKGSSR